jgi:hypothetical protein
MVVTYIRRKGPHKVVIVVQLVSLGSGALERICLFARILAGDCPVFSRREGAEVGENASGKRWNCL